jgi:FdhD protein
MMATPSDLEDFALGFSITEELLPTASDLKSVEVIRYSRGIELQLTVSPECEAEITSRSRRLAGRTGCGICGADSIAGVLKQLHPVAARTTVSAQAIHRAMLQLDQRQELNRSAGAVHAAAWASLGGEVQLLREDVGRHNALDKLIGGLLKRGSDPGSGFMLVTSRASFEMVQKATVFGAPVLASISGPTGLAIRVAQQAGLTLVGFTRPDRHTIYTHPARITH